MKSKTPAPLYREPDYAAARGLLAGATGFLFTRAGLEENGRAAAIRHARAAVTHGRDDATALSLGVFAIGFVEHDHAAPLKHLSAHSH